MNISEMRLINFETSQALAYLIGNWKIIPQQTTAENQGIWAVASFFNFGLIEFLTST